MPEMEIPEDPDEEYTKEVTMVAYAPQDVKDWRGWLNSLIAVDLYERGSYTKRDWEVEIDPAGEGNDWDIFTRNLSTIHADEEVVRQMCKDLEKVDNISMTFEKEKKETFNTGSGVAAKNILRSLLNEAPSHLSGSISKEEDSLRWNNPSEHEFSVRVSQRSITEMRVLSKETKREDDDMYETLGERLCLRFELTMTAPSQDFIDVWTEELIPDIHKILARQDEFEKVRYMSCTTQVSREGECYNI